MNEMNALYFYRESNNFDDILSDISVKPLIRTKIRFTNYLLLELNDKADDKILGYITLKYGDSFTHLSDKDYSPIPNVDYIPKR